MGYTPVFDTLTKGTLCGKWPDIGLWPVLLSMADWKGEIDATQQYIAAVTGLALADVMKCLDRFCNHDERSRSGESGGARLELVDPERGWGWRVINFQKYRDKASNAKQVSDGRNAEKVRRYKERHRGTPGDTGGHPPTPSNTDSYSYSYSDSEKIKNKTGATPRATATKVRTRIVPESFQVTDRMRAWAAEKIPGVDVDLTTESFRDHEFKDPHSNWEAAWRQWMRRTPEFSRRPATNGKAAPSTWMPPADDKKEVA